jgi:predicted O-methyltransferase YrrM
LINSLRSRFVNTWFGQIALRSKLRITYSESGRAIYLSRGIEGWLSDPEADALYKLARYHSPSANPVVVEIGSWKGKSSSVLAAGLLNKSNPSLFCIDPFGEDENPDYQERYYDPLSNQTNQQPIDQFRTNMGRCGVGDIVRAIKGYSFDSIQTWERPIDVLFIDANHEYESVLRDFILWSPFVRPGGIVALHDAGDVWPGPTRVASEHLVLPYYKGSKQIDTLAWAVKVSDLPSLSKHFVNPDRGAGMSFPRIKDHAQ